MTMLWVEHDMELVGDLADTVTVLDFGEKIAEGPPDVVLQTRGSRRLIWLRRRAGGGRAGGRQRSSLMLLPTSVVGSHGLPGWVWLAREAMEAGRMGASDVRELMEDATQVALLDQERAGRRAHRRDDARAVHHRPTRASPASGRSRPRSAGPAALGHEHALRGHRVDQRADGLGIVDEFKLARALTTKPLKATVRPYTLLVPLKLGGGYKDWTPLADWSASSTPSAGRWSTRAPTSSRSTSRTAGCTRARPRASTRV